MNFKKTFRLSIVILFFISGQTFANTRDTISVNIQNQSLKYFLNVIEQKTNYTFVYNNSEINTNQLISYNSDKQKLSAILTHVFNKIEVDYQIVGKQIILTKKEKPLPLNMPVEITGVVMSKLDSITIPGVNVLVKGTSIGTTTDIHGNFKLTTPENITLVFSFLGYATQEIKISNKTNLLVLLEKDNKTLDEVVVVGYGSESKKIISSSLSNIKAEVITESIGSTISESIKGKLPGLYVNQNSGAPGAAHTVRIRGISSITAGADPLYIVDGVPVVALDLSQIYFNGQGVNTITDINIADIESITILKDASATAIYGARGSNGVILISTKRGSKNKSSICFNARYGVQQVSNKYDMLNAEEYMRYKNNAAINDGGVAIYSEQDIQNNTVDTDWQSELYHITPIESYDLSLSNGSEKTYFYLIANYFNQEGIVKGTDYNRVSARLNLDHHYSKKLHIGTSIAISKSVNNRKEGDQTLNGPVPNAISLPPIYPVYNADGSYNEDGPLANPISIANEHTNIAYCWNNLGNLFANYKILENLSLKANFGVNYFNFREHTYDPPTTRQGAKYEGLGIESTSEALKTLFNSVLNYSVSFKNNHIINALVGYEIDQEQISSTFMRGESFASEYLEYLISSVEKVSADATYKESLINSYFGRVKYRFDSKYILTLNARYDGSSRFSQKNKYGFFPSGDIAWRISDENFFTIDFISDLKLRASYGITGNDKIPDFLYISRFATSEYAELSAIYPANISSPDLKWETTKQLNTGIDLSFIKERIIITADYYEKKTEDLLLEKPVPPSSGFEGKITNIGKIENKGFELYLQTINIKSKLYWESQFNISFNRNKVTQLYNNQPIDNIGRGSQRIEVGQPIGIFYGYKSLGVDPSTGDIVFEDINKDGVLDVNDKTKIGSPHAKFQGGFINRLRYQNFNLDIFLQFSYGNDVFNGTLRYIEAMKDTDNQTTAILDRWQEPGDITEIPRATNSDPNENNRVSSRYIEDGSFLKLKSIKFTYNLPDKYSQKLNISNLSMFILAQNIYTCTNYRGLDPEVNYAGADVIRSGVEFFTYPPAKIYSVGLSLKF